jgi:hypothetical protein
MLCRILFDKEISVTEAERMDGDSRA